MKGKSMKLSTNGFHTGRACVPVWRNSLIHRRLKRRNRFLPVPDIIFPGVYSALLQHRDARDPDIRQVV
jgi:hypothetical protein